MLNESHGQFTRFLQEQQQEDIGNKKTKRKEGNTDIQFRAAEWGDLATSFLWKGRLRVVSKGRKCEIRLEDSSSGNDF